MCSDRFLRFLLRFEGTLTIFAILAVPMPYTWMNAIHGWLGLGELPPEPIVGYLARSTSAFYALLGVWMWLLSFDLQRHRPSLIYLGIAMIAFGLMLAAVDWVEGLPFFWKIGEGPLVATYGTSVFILARRIDPEECSD